MDPDQTAPLQGSSLIWVHIVCSKGLLSKCISTEQIGLLRVSEYSDIRGSEYKIEYEYSSLPKSFDRDLFFLFFYLFCY